jgi:hypothetical protein
MRPFLISYFSILCGSSRTNGRLLVEVAAGVKGCRVQVLYLLGCCCVRLDLFFFLRPFSSCPFPPQLQLYALLYILSLSTPLLR